MDKYVNSYCTFNDDIQGTASVAVAGLLASKRITGKTLAEHTIVFLGAGEAAVGIANLCTTAMEMEGLSAEEARSKIWMMDIDGLLAKGRPEGNLDGHKALYVKDKSPTKDLLAVVTDVKPSIIIGASAAAGAFTPQILEKMAELNERPIIFALSNPTSKAECTAEQAYTHTKGRCVFASGSPFPPVTYDGKTYKTGQGNNAYIFPGVALGVIATGMHHISNHLFIIAAQVPVSYRSCSFSYICYHVNSVKPIIFAFQAVANSVQDADLESGSLYPPLNNIRDCSIKIASEIAKYAYEKG